MLTIQCTKKLLEALKLSVPYVKEDSGDPPYAWHAYLFLFNRRNHVIAMNNMTRYNFILPSLKREEFKKFDSLVVHAIADNLQTDGIDPVLVRQYLKKADMISYSATSDRSILGQINEMIMVAKLTMEADKNDGVETDIYELNRRFNRFVMLKLPQLYSSEAMRDALNNMALPKFSGIS